MRKMYGLPYEQDPTKSQIANADFDEKEDTPTWHGQK